MLLSDKYPFLTNYFTTALNTKGVALPQSLLFYGNDLESQYILANEIARLLNCSDKKLDECECLNCKWIRNHSHPAVLTISRVDNKPEDDDSKTVISIKQSLMIKDDLLSSSKFHRVYIFCDRDDNGHILGLNSLNFQAETANSLLKIIEEPQPGVTFIFLTRYIEDVLSTIVSRSQCFFVPSFEKFNYDYTCVKEVFENYFNFKRDDVFNLSQKLNDLTKEYSVQEVLNSMQCYVLAILKQNTNNTLLVKHIKFIEDAKKQDALGIRSINIFDELCLNLIE